MKKRAEQEPPPPAAPDRDAGRRVTPTGTQLAHSIGGKVTVPESFE